MSINSNPLGQRVSTADVDELTKLVNTMSATSSKGSRLFRINVKGEDAIAGQVKLNDLVKRAMELSKEDNVDQKKLKQLMFNIKDLDERTNNIGIVFFRTIATKFSFDGNRKKTIENMELEADAYVKIAECIKEHGNDPKKIAEVINTLKRDYESKHKKKNFPKEIDLPVIVQNCIIKAQNSLDEVAKKQQEINPIRERFEKAIAERYRGKRAPDNIFQNIKLIELIKFPANEKDRNKFQIWLNLLEPLISQWEKILENPSDPDFLGKQTIVIGKLLMLCARKDKVDWENDVVRKKFCEENNINST